MKRTTILISTLLIFQLAFSQVLIKRDTIYPKQVPKEVAKSTPINTRPKVETLFQDQKAFGGYLGINMGYTKINGDDAFIAGGRVMFVANHYIGIGFGGKGFMTMPTTDTAYDFFTTTYIANVGGYGGMYIEPVLYSLKPIHISFPILIGAGGIVTEVWSDDWLLTKLSTSAYFLVEPGIDAEFNIAQWFRIGVGASYRLTSKTEGLAERPSDLLNGLNYNLTFKFGWF